jgi:hypothetical protein
MLVSRSVPAPVAVSAGVLALFAVAALSGCEGLAEQRLTYNRTENVKVTEIEINPGAGDVVVRSGAVTDVRIERVVQYRGDEPSDTTYRFDGTKLLIETDCGRHCGVSYEILAPEGVAVRGQNGSGDIRLTDVSEVDVKVGSGDISVDGATGAVRAETGSGDVTVSGVPGTVWAHTGSGSIEGRDLGAGEVQAEAASGDITLTLRTAGSVRANASSGNVTLAVPAGSYRVQAQADSGSTNVAVQNDPAAKISLEARTGSGDITIGSN